MKILILSDLHLGHHVNKTENILDHLRRFFKSYHSEIKTCSAIIIAGDIFDRLLSTNNHDTHRIYEWLTELLLYCKDYNIALRVLEGTPSHDWKQFKLLYKSLTKLNINIDLEYFENITLHNDKHLNKNILYIPDEITPTPKETYTLITDYLNELNNPIIDMIVMHGAFSFQLPDFIEHTHNPEDYLKLTNGPIIAGHVHTQAIYKRILIPGSFDALSHSDDDLPKGGLLLSLNQNNKFNFKYLDNKFKMVFTSIALSDTELSNIKKILNKFKPNSHIRFIIKDDSQTSSLKNELKLLYPDLTITFTKPNKSKSNSISLLKQKTSHPTKLQLDYNYINNYIHQRIDQDHLNPTTTKIILNELQQLK